MSLNNIFVNQLACMDVHTLHRRWATVPQPSWLPHAASRKNNNFWKTNKWVQDVTTWHSKQSQRCIRLIYTQETARLLLQHTMTCRSANDRLENLTLHDCKISLYVITNMIGRRVQYRINLISKGLLIILNFFGIITVVAYCAEKTNFTPPGSRHPWEKCHGDYRPRC